MLIRDIVLRCIVSLLIACGCAVGIGACGSDRTVQKARTTVTGGGTSAASISGSTAAVDVIAFLFPRDASDVAAGVTYEAFERATTQREVASCLAKDGLPGPPPAPPASASSNFPDLSLMQQQHALTYAPDSGNLGKLDYASPATKMPKSEAHAYDHAFTACTKRADHPFAELDGQAGEAAVLYDRFSEAYDQVTDSRPVQEAGKAAQRCAARRGFRFSAIHGDYMAGAILDENGAVFDVEAKKGKPAAIAQDAVDAEILARCLAPLDATRGALLTKARAQLFASNALAIRQLQADAQRVVSKLLAQQQRVAG